MVSLTDAVNCEILDSLNQVTNHLLSKISSCNMDEEINENLELVRVSAHWFKEKESRCRFRTNLGCISFSQTLLSLHSLGNIGVHNTEVESKVMQCSANTAVPEVIRVAAFRTLGKGSCTAQVYIMTYIYYLVEPYIYLAAIYKAFTSNKSKYSTYNIKCIVLVLDE